MFNPKFVFVLVFFGAFLVFQITEASPKSNRKTRDAGPSDAGSSDAGPSNAEKIYEEFSITHNGKEIRFQIKDLSATSFSDAADILLEYYHGEDFFSYMNVNPENKRADYLANMGQNISLACIEAETGKLVGVNLLMGKYKGHYEFNRIPDELYKMVCKPYYFNVFEHYKVDFYIDSDGLAVITKYRGLGIEEKLLRCTRFICEKWKLPVASIVFQTATENRQAERAGFVNINEEFKLADLMRANPNKYSFLVSTFGEKNEIARRTIVYEF